MSYGNWKLNQLLIQQFWADSTFLYKLGFWQNFAMTSQETSYMNNINSDFCWLLIRHVSTYGLVATEF
jgi:hypothetical protein